MVTAIVKLKGVKPYIQHYRTFAELEKNRRFIRGEGTITVISKTRPKSKRKPRPKRVRSIFDIL